MDDEHNSISWSSIFIKTPRNKRSLKYCLSSVIQKFYTVKMLYVIKHSILFFASYRMNSRLLRNMWFEIKQYKLFCFIKKWSCSTLTWKRLLKWSQVKEKKNLNKFRNWETIKTNKIIKMCLDSVHDINFN